MTNSTLKLDYGNSQILITQQPADYESSMQEYMLGEGIYRPSSCCTVQIFNKDGTSKNIAMKSAGGASGVHENSAFTYNNILLIALGPYVSALKLPDLGLLWSTEADPYTCFGIFYSLNHQCIISHGEGEIARLDYQGTKIWAGSGKDIFTGEFKLYDDHLEVTDFEENKYRFEISSGTSKIIA